MVSRRVHAFRLVLVTSRLNSLYTIQLVSEFRIEFHLYNFTNFTVICKTYKESE